MMTSRRPTRAPTQVGFDHDPARLSPDPQWPDRRSSASRGLTTGPLGVWPRWNILPLGVPAQECRRYEGTRQQGERSNLNDRGHYSEHGETEQTDASTPPPR